jgi:hypothetical protein
MLEFKDSSGYVFYLNHLISFCIMGPVLFWTCWLLQKRKIDKVLHITASASLVLLFIGLLPVLKIAWWISPIIVLAIGLGKEIWDYYNPKKRKFDPMDLIADLIGIGTVTIVYLISFAMHDPKM